MKPLAAALAAAVLGSGCIVVDDDDCFGTVTIEWDFRTAGGVVTGCAGAGVVDVDVFLDGQSVGSFSCFDGGATVTRVRPGSYLFTVEGIGADQLTILYRDEFTVDARSCGDAFVHARPAAGFVNLDYTVPDDTCAASPSYLWFAVRDGITGTVTAVVDVSSAFADQTLYACPGDVAFAMPAGPHTLEWMEELVLAGASWEVWSRDCTDRPFDVVAGTTTIVPVALADATAACDHPL